MLAAARRKFTVISLFARMPFAWRTVTLFMPLQVHYETYAQEGCESELVARASTTLALRGLPCGARETAHGLDQHHYRI